MPVKTRALSYINAVGDGRMLRLCSICLRYLKGVRCTGSCRSYAVGTGGSAVLEEVISLGCVPWILLYAGSDALCVALHTDGCWKVGFIC